MLSTDLKPIIELTNTSGRGGWINAYYVDGQKIDIYKDHLILYFPYFLPWKKPRKVAIPYSQIKELKFRIAPFDLGGGGSGIMILTNDGVRYELHTVKTELIKQTQKIIAERNPNI